MQQILWSLVFNIQLYKTVNDHVKQGMRKICSRLLNGIMAIGDFSTAKQRAKNNTHVRLKTKCCRLVELTQNIRIKIANADREHRMKIRLKAGKCLSRRVKSLTVKITGGRKRNNSQPHLGTTITGIPSLFPVE
jgi:hypothetical protein